MALAWPRVPAMAGRGSQHHPAALAWPREDTRGFGPFFDYRSDRVFGSAVVGVSVGGGVIACCAFAGWAPSIDYGTPPPLSAPGLGGLAPDRVWHSVEGCRATPRGCSLVSLWTQKM